MKLQGTGIWSKSVKLKEYASVEYDVGHLNTDSSLFDKKLLWKKIAISQIWL